MKKLQQGHLGKECSSNKIGLGVTFSFIDLVRDWYFTITVTHCAPSLHQKLKSPILSRAA